MWKYSPRSRTAGFMVRQPRNGRLPPFRGHGTEKFLEPYRIGRQFGGPADFATRVSVENVRGKYRRRESDGCVRRPGIAHKQAALPEPDEPGLHRDRRRICHRPVRREPGRSFLDVRPGGPMRKNEWRYAGEANRRSFSHAITSWRTWDNSSMR